MVWISLSCLRTGSKMGSNTFFGTAPMFRRFWITLPILIFFFIFSINKVFAAEVSFSLSPASGSYNVNETFDLKVILDTGGTKVGGADIYLTFDQNKLNLVDIENGTIFGQYVGETINNTNGTSAISGISNSQDTDYTGNDTFVILRFKALSPGQVEVKFNFTPGSTKDTNAIDPNSFADLLTSVTNGSYTIVGEGGTTGGITVTPTKPIPVTANEIPTILVIGFGIFLLTSGFVLKRLSTLKSF